MCAGFRRNSASCHGTCGTATRSRYASTGTQEITADHPAPGGHGRRTAPAQRILEAALRLRDTRRATAPSRPGTTFATARVRVADGGPGRGPLTAVGVWHDPRRPPAEVWLSHVRAMSASTLLSLTGLSEQVEQGWRTLGGTVGLRDFEGRSLQGRHRHMTLASCAYAISALTSKSAAGHSVYGEGVKVCELYSGPQGASVRRPGSGPLHCARPGRAA